MGKKYRPMFAGRTPEGEQIIIYLRIGSTDDFHILGPDGVFQPLSLGAKIDSWFDGFNDTLHVRIESPEWSGTAVGSRKDLYEAEAR